MDEIKTASGFLQDLFYDVLAYVVPSSILFAMTLYLAPRSVSGPLLQSYIDLKSGIDKVVVVLFVVGLLYATGQLLITFSRWIVWGPLGALAYWRKWSGWFYGLSEADFAKKKGKGKIGIIVDPNAYGEWHHDYIQVNSEDTRLGLETTKRIARMNMARSSALVFLLLGLLAYRFYNPAIIVLCLLLFLFFLIDAYRRRVGVNNWLSRISGRTPRLEGEEEPEPDSRE